MTSDLNRALGMFIGTELVVGSMLVASMIASKYETEATKYREKNPEAPAHRVLKYMLDDGIKGSYNLFVKRMTKNKKDGLRWWTNRVNNDD